MMLRGLRRLIHTGFVSSEGMRPWLGTLVVLVLTAVSEGCDGRKEFSLGHELKPQSTEELLALSETSWHLFVISGLAGRVGKTAGVSAVSSADIRTHVLPMG